MTWDTLLNCISGAASPAEQQACQAWLAAHADNRALYQRLQGRYRQRQQSVPAEEVARQWAQLQTRLHGLPAEEPAVIAPAPDRAGSSWWRLAAAVLVLAVATVLLVRPRWSAQVPAWTTVQATTQRRLVHLPDGSAVWLARRSSLSYPADFGRRTRPVRLRGAAFFEVRKNPARPFTVQTACLRVRVLGTSFQVLARDGAAAVAVATGVVAVQTGAAQHRLYPGQQLTYQPGAAARVTPVSLAAARGLRSDTLQFERSSLPQIARQLSSWYGLPVRLAPGAEAARVAFSGRIPDTGLPQVLEGLSFATDHRFRLTAQHTIVIQPNAH